MDTDYNGWIKVHRKIMKTPEYFQEPFTRMQAWFDMLLIAQHKKSFYRNSRAVRIDVYRGQIGYSKERLAHRWQWNIKKCVRFLADLVEDGQILMDNTNITTIITIVNYDKYQPNNDVTEKDMPPRKTASEKKQKGAQKNAVKPSKPQQIHINFEKNGSAEGVAVGGAKEPKEGTFKNAKGSAEKREKRLQEIGKRIAVKPSKYKDFVFVVDSTGNTEIILEKILQGGAKGSAKGRTKGLHNKKDTKVSKRSSKKFKEGDEKKEKNSSVKKASPAAGETGEKNEAEDQISRMAGEKINSKTQNNEEMNIDSQNNRYVCREMHQIWKQINPDFAADEILDFPHLLKIAEFIARQLGKNAITASNQPEILKIWEVLSGEVAKDAFYAGKPLSLISAHIQKFYKKNSNGQQINSSVNQQSASITKPTKITRVDAIRSWPNKPSN